MEGLIKIFILASFLWCSESKILDSFNREIEISNKIERIVAVGAGALRVISYLDAVDIVVGVENIEVKYPKGRAYAVKNYERFEKLPIIGEGGPDRKPDYERIIMLKPDIIIASSLTKDLVNDIERNTKIKVAALDYGSLGSFDTDKFKEVVLKMGKLLKKEKRAKFLIGRIDSYISDLKKRSNLSLKKNVYVGGIGFKGSHGITSTQYDYEPFKFLRIKSVIDKDSKKGLKHIFISKETILSLNPDIIFIDMGGIRMVEDDFKNDKTFYLMLKAFKNGNVYTTLPFNYYTTNVEVVFINAYFIGKVLFPENFKDVDMRSKCSQIMRDFLGDDVCDSFVDDKNFYKRILIDNGSFRYEDI